MNELVITLLLGGGFLVLFAAGELLFHVLKTPAEISRKFVHLSSGFLTLTFPVFLHTHWYVLALCLSFAIILAVSRKFNFLQSINNVGRDTRGSYLFPAAVYSAYLFFSATGDLLFFFLPILILAISDPLAALVGKRWPVGRYRVGNEFKSLSGSSAFFVSAMATSALLLMITSELSAAAIAFVAIPVSLASCLSEALSRKGWDNIFIPLTAALTYFFILKML